MALGAWLLLFQNNLAPGGPGGPGSGSVGGVSGIEPLTTFAPNTLPVTGFHDSFTHEVAKENAQALALGSNGSALYVTKTISAGHNHEEGAESALLWRQIQTTLFYNGGRAGAAVNPGTAPDEAVDSLAIETLLEVDKSFTRLWLNPIQAKAVVPRVKVSADNKVTFQAKLALYFYTPAGVFVGSSLLTIDTTVVFARQWYSFAAIDLSAVARDARIPSRIPLIVRFAANLVALGDVVAVHELAFGVIS